MSQMILAIDQGTTYTKAILIDRMMRVRAQAVYPVKLSYPRPGWVEHDLNDLWASVQEAIGICIQSVQPLEIAAIAITNQRETAAAWHRVSGEPLGPAISWQCRRTLAKCQELRAKQLEGMIRQRTGLQIDPMFSSTKWLWLLEHLPSQAHLGEQDICLGTVDSWLIWKLSGGQRHATDLTNASRTQLLNLDSLHWDEDLLMMLGIPRHTLPEILPSAGLYCHTAGHGMLEADIPILSVIGDSQAALVGHGVLAPGEIKCTYGTGSSLLTITPERRHANGLSETIAVAWHNRALYGMEGNIYSTGATVQWIAEILGLRDPYREIESLARQVASSEGVYIVPAFVGLGAPHWDPEAKGLIAGITRGTQRAHLARAALESIALQVKDVFDVMRSSLGLKEVCLLADGGATGNNLLMQIQADILGCKVQRSKSSNLSALGTAFLAGTQLGWWDLDDARRLRQAYDVFEPKASGRRRDAIYLGWQEALKRSRSRLI